MNLFPHQHQDLSDAQLVKIASMVRAASGINLNVGKKELVKTRLLKRMRSLKLATFRDYLDYLGGDNSGSEFMAMLDVITTNQTSFFREVDHFDYLAREALPRFEKEKGPAGKLRIWSAGCSTGEEPYTISMVLNEKLAGLGSWDAKILATDLAPTVLARARAGLYGWDRLQSVPPPLRNKYFDLVGRRRDGRFTAKDNIRYLIRFAKLNLMEPWPMKGPFDVIFCRNVMIYFEKETQARLVNRYFDILRPGGLLFIGHSESLTGVSHGFKYIRPTVYLKP